MSSNRGIHENRFNNIDFSGYWLGDYGDNGIELVEIIFYENQWKALKLTGDKNVPANKFSFTFNNDFSVSGISSGQIQVAHIGYDNPRWLSGSLEAISSDHVTFQWNSVRRHFHRISSSYKGSNYLFNHDDVLFDQEQIPSELVNL
eukprot:gb/GECH01004152.1/.p1 GENE.gb/GECH01004152.1/~~gb/GECH01004152.1/.p1  ORF type:complete len:146 (+),score=38.83 gb/GECH01004152.1/:1-438(+)